MVSEEKRFENVERRQATDDIRQKKKKKKKKKGSVELKIQSKKKLLFLFLNNRVLSVYGAIWFLRRFLKVFFTMAAILVL